MLRLSNFEVMTPATVAEAAALVADNAGAVVIAGGTDLVPKMKRGQIESPILVSLGRIDELRRISVEDGGLRIGALTTLRTLEHDAYIGRSAHLRSLRLASGLVATPIIRNSATVGGNLLQDTRCRYYDRSLFWRDAVGYCLKKEGDECRVAPGGGRCFATFCSDLAPALSVLDARVTLAGRENRTLPVNDLYRDDGIDYADLGRNILTEVFVPDSDFRSTYKKLRVRDVFDFPEAGVAVAVRDAGDAVQVRAAITGVGSRMTTLEETVPRDALRDFAEDAFKSIKPVDTMFFPPAYRKKMARHFLLKALDELLAAG